MSGSTFETFVIVTDTESLRWQHYRRELDRVLSTLDDPPRVHTIEWITVADREGDIEDLLPSRCLLRVESPAQDFRVFQKLLRAGENAEGRPWQDWTPQHEGWIASPRLIHAGLRRVLGNVAESVIAQCGALESSMTDTIDLCDKNVVSRRLTEHGIETPEYFVPESVEAFYSLLADRRWQFAYAKLAHGSCASGILVCTAGPPATALTTVAEIDGRFYNSYALRSVSGDELNRVLQLLIDEGITVQRSIDKTCIVGDPFDARMIVIGGMYVGAVFRASTLPITNLHLGGYRAPERECRRLISDRSWYDAVDDCERAAALFDMSAVGIDLAFDRESGSGSIIEMNAFGDFIPNWTSQNGCTIHELEIAQSLRRFFCAPSDLLSPMME